MCGYACVHVCAHWRCLCVCICADLCLSTQRYTSDTPTLPDLSSESMCSAREVNEPSDSGVHIRAHLDLRQTRSWQVKGWERGLLGGCCLPLLSLLVCLAPGLWSWEEHSRCGTRPRREAFPGTCFVITGPQELGFLYKLAGAKNSVGQALGVPATLPAVPPPSSRQGIKRWGRPPSAGFSGH